MPFISTEFQKVTHFAFEHSATVSSNTCALCANPASNPLINNGDRTVVLCYSKVVYPSSNILPELHHPVSHGYSPTTTGEFLDTSLEFLKRLFGPTDFTALKSKAEKCTFLDRYQASTGKNVNFH